VVKCCNPFPCAYLQFVALAAMIVRGPAPACAADAPSEPAAVTAAQIEADWLHQDEKRQSTPLTGNRVASEDDAAGAVDGVKNGKWGFHTEFEENPWWQIDLGKPTPIGRLVLYNRCDLADRNARIIAWVSDEAKSWRQVYQHNGKVFYGYTDGKPLDVDLKGVQARYVRLGLAGKMYFHVDEVEIYPPGGK